MEDGSSYPRLAGKKQVYAGTSFPTYESQLVNFQEVYKPVIKYSTYLKLY